MDKLFSAISKLSGKVNTTERVYADEFIVVENLIGDKFTQITILKQPTDRWRSFRDHASKYEYLKVIAKPGILYDCRNMFDSLGNILQLDVSELNVNDVEDMGYMFARCVSLKELDLSSFQTSNVVDMSHMFRECCNLEMIKQYFDTSKVEDLSSMFEACIKLHIVGELRHWEVQHVRLFDSMFEGCSSMESLNIIYWAVMPNASYLKMLKGCDKLNDLNLPKVFDDNLDKLKLQ